ncbi:MAG: hypothetical protein HY921_08720 [Elusimicrobia bacterium]|nr:hypothetical protein [Elusimicrobiota bacterium]
MARFLSGLVLMPSAVLTLAAGVQALALSAWRGPSAFPFFLGFGLSLACGIWAKAGKGECVGPASWFSSLSRKIYVFGHELTHALAAWSVGAKVLGFKVTESRGHVDLSHSNAFIALAPYCVPIYSLLAILSYRLWLWLRPEHPMEPAFLFVMGLTLSFHMAKTLESLWALKQPDLAAGGGIVFSLSWIVLGNGLVILVLLKTLFPRSVALLEELESVCLGTGHFWLWIWRAPGPSAWKFVKRFWRGA